MFRVNDFSGIGLFCTVSVIFIIYQFLSLNVSLGLSCIGFFSVTKSQRLILINKLLNYRVQILEYDGLFTTFSFGVML